MIFLTSAGAIGGPARRSPPTRFTGHDCGLNKHPARSVLDPVLTPGFIDVLGPPRPSPGMLGIRRPRPALKRPALEVELVTEAAEITLAVAIKFPLASGPAKPLI